MRVLVTGADGFIGTAFCRMAKDRGHVLSRVVRRRVNNDAEDRSTTRGNETRVVPDIGPDTNWEGRLQGIDAVVHLAARTHVMRETAADPLAEYRRVNVAGTLALAQQAAVAGVRRLVFLSSVKVIGERTETHPYTEDDLPRPEDAYGISKWEAEQVLRRIAAETGLEVVVLRPPLVYGPGVKGNFLRLMNLVSRGVPLPLTSIENHRSLIYVGNLVDAIVAAIESPRAAGNTYLVSDGEDVSTPQLIRAVAAALGVPARLFPFPVALLKLGARALGRSEEATRLVGSLQIDNSKIRRELGWTPRYTLEQGLAETARWFKSRESSIVIRSRTAAARRRIG